MIENQRIMLLSVGGKNEHFCQLLIFFNYEGVILLSVEKNMQNLNTFSFSV